MSLSSASSARGALNALRLVSCSTTSCPTPTPLRTFYTSTHNLGARPARVKAARQEMFNWRRLDAGLPIPRVPQVDYTRDVNEAEELLDSFRASRLSMHIASKSVETHQRDGGTVWNAGKVAVLSIADAEGVVVVHLSHMKSIPPRLRAILEDPKIVKQAFGAIGYVQEFEQDPEMFDGVHCESMLDLRELGSILYPRLREPDTESMPHSGIRKLACMHLFGQDHSTPGTGHNFDVSKLGGISLDYVANAAWLTQQLGVKFLDRLDEFEDEAAQNVGVAGAAQVVEAVLERAGYSTLEHRSLKARYR